MKSKLKQIFLLMILTSSTASFAAEQKVNLMSDDSEVFTHLAERYIASHIKLKPNMKKRSFGVSYTSFDQNDYPKVGFIGYEFTDSNNNDVVIKLQLIKNEQGWAVANVLANDKIHEANPIFSHHTDHARTEHSRNAKVAAATLTQTWLNQQGSMQNVRATSTRCYLTKDTLKASCHTVYGLKDKGEVTCLSKSHLLAQHHDVWKKVKEIQYNQKVDYTTGELKVVKPFTKYCY